MKYVSVIQDSTYLLWQQELQVFNMRRLGLVNDLVVVILIEPGQSPSPHALKLARLANVRIYENRQQHRHYLPSNKPYGLMRLLEHHPEYGDRLFLMDSDVIFREPLNLSPILEDDVWYVSDSGAIGYLGYDYLTSCMGHDLVDEMASIVGLTANDLKAQQPNSGGAQYLMKGVTADYCRRVAEDSIKIYDWSVKQLKEDGEYKFQVWTAEMWAWLWHAFKIATVRTHPELAFTWAPHSIRDWETHKMLHVAGITSRTSHPGAFFKGSYTGLIPWEDPELCDGLSKDLMTWVYVQLMLDYREELKARR